MASGPPDLVPPEFKRCGIKSNFSGRVKRTTFELYDYKERIKVSINVEWNEKTRLFSIAEAVKGGRKDRRPNTKWEKLVSG